MSSLARPDGLDRRRLAQLLRLFDAEQEGEAIAALTALRRLLASAGVKFRDIVGGDDVEQLRDYGSAAPAHAIEAADLLRNGRGWLTRFEVDFLIGIAAFSAPTSRQLATLAGIRHKIEAAQAAERAA